MIVYVDLEHERLRRHPQDLGDPLLDPNRLEIKYRLEDIADDLCLIVKYNLLSVQRLRELSPTAVVVSGGLTDWDDYPKAAFEELTRIFTEPEWPILTFCSGFLLMVRAHGGEVGPLGPRAEGDPMPPLGLNVTPGMKQERGYVPVRALDRHPLFEGLGTTPVFWESHFWGVRDLPACFVRLAETDLCGVQAAAHRDLPLFGLQFHPEQYNDAHQAGRLLLENFIRMVREPEAGSPSQQRSA